MRAALVGASLVVAPVLGGGPLVGTAAASPRAASSTTATTTATLAATTAAQTPVTPQPVASGELETAGCHDVLFVGVRGSGEEVPWGHTLGGVVRLLQNELDQPVQQVWLEYPAVDPHSLAVHDLEAHVLDDQPPATEYFDSVASGQQELTRVLSASAEGCPAQQVVVAGFSQGAQVITRALAGGADSSTLAGALLLGNPAHHPGQNVREPAGQVDTPSIGLSATLTYLRATARPDAQTTRREGVRNLIDQVFALHAGEVANRDIATTLAEAGEVIAPGDYARILSVCSEGDLVCDAAPAMSRMLTSSSTLEEEFAATRPIHGGYDEEVVGLAVSELAQLVGTQDAGSMLDDAPTVDPGPMPGAPGEPSADSPAQPDPAPPPEASAPADPAPPVPADPGAEGAPAATAAPAVDGARPTPAQHPLWLVPALFVAVGLLSLTTVGLAVALWRRR